MKKNYLVLLIIFFLNSCTPMPEQVMPPLQYNMPINLHLNKKAYLQWKVGEQYSSTVPVALSGNPIADTIGVAIINREYKRNPGRFTFTYGKPQQAVFMTSLKNTLEQQHVFNTIEIITHPHQINSDDVLITVEFKMTRVSSADEKYKIILDAELAIIQGGKLQFNRTYLVESNPGRFFSTISFKNQQTDVSQQLMQRIIFGIKQWSYQIKQR